MRAVNGNFGFQFHWSKRFPVFSDDKKQGKCIPCDVHHYEMVNEVEKIIL